MAQHDAWFSPVKRQPTLEVVDTPKPHKSVVPKPSQTSQTTPTAEPQIVATLNTRDGVLEIPYIEGPDIKIDGRVDEPLWQSISAIDGMRVIDPDSMEDAEYATDTRIFFTHRGLYVSAVMEQP